MGLDDLSASDVSLSEVAKEVPEAVLEGELVRVQREKLGEHERVERVVQLLLWTAR